jgi:pilus assembly protein Flp/PilA
LLLRAKIVRTARERSGLRAIVKPPFTVPSTAPGSGGFSRPELTTPQVSAPIVGAWSGTRMLPKPTRSFRQHHSMETTMKNLFARFLKDESGATAIEYGLIAAGISLAIIAAVNSLGTALSSKFSAISSSLK